MSGALSVVIPTRDRSAQLARTLERCVACAGSVDLELVVVDDGSQDDTPQRLAELAQRLPSLRCVRTDPRGPARARNLGASMASRPVVLFLGDDVEPADDGFFRVHADLHAQRTERELAVLGKVVWPDRADWPVGLAMALAQGPEGDQFRYADLEPCRFLDWRYFYTANVSVKRDLVSDWLADGFSEKFPLASYEDAEFAYRRSLAKPPLQIFYAPLSVGHHLHRHTTGSFLERQLHAGLMASTFVAMHPEREARAALGVDDLIARLDRVSAPSSVRAVADCLAMIEGVKAWVRLLDERGNAGSQPWHADLLRAAFRLAWRQGFVLGAARPGANPADAYYLALEEFARDSKRAFQIELAGRALSRGDAASWMGLPTRAIDRLRVHAHDWLRRLPGGLRAARAARRAWRGRA